MGKIIGLFLLMIISSVSYSAENSTPQKDDNSQLDLISEEVQNRMLLLQWPSSNNLCR